MFKPRFVLRSFSGEENLALSGKTLQSLLTALTSINLDIMRERGDAGRPLPLLYQSGVRYVRDGESSDPSRSSEDWQDCLEVLARREADCKSLAAYRAAEVIYRTGRPAFAQFRWRDRDYGTLYHIVVQHENGSIEDPSAKLGMFNPRHH